jgi:NADPH2:quinone reductase
MPATKSRWPKMENQMRAQVITAFGEPDVFRLETLPDPLPAPGEVIVAVAATSVNPVDYKTRRNGNSIAPALPAVLGCDIAGTITAVGTDVTSFKVGDEVYGCAGGVAGVSGGSYAERIAADARLLAHKPTSLTFREAAALPLVTITAWEALERAGVREGTDVLIHGGAGGVGHVAIQLAKALGANVFTTVSSGEKAQLVKRLGADHVINYREESVADYVARLTGGSGFEVVFDATGGSDIAASFDAARLNGHVVTIVSKYEADLSPMHVKGLSLHVVFMLIPMLHDTGREAHGRLLSEAAVLANAGKLRPLLDPERFTLEDLPRAHAKLEAGQAIGKLVIEVDEL